MSEEELKPCPFCGSKNIEYITDTDNQKDSHYSFIVCHGCHIELEHNIDKKLTMFPVGKVENWNTRASQWISVKDRLPEKNNKRYLCFIEQHNIHLNGYIDIKRFIHNDRFIYLDENEKVIYWMPLPEPPENKK